MFLGNTPYVIINRTTKEILCCKVKQTYEFGDKFEIAPNFYKVPFSHTNRNIVWQLRKSEAESLLPKLKANWSSDWEIITLKEAINLGINLNNILLPTHIQQNDFL